MSISITAPAVVWLSLAGVPPQMSWLTSACAPNAGSNTGDCTMPGASAAINPSSVLIVSDDE